MFGLCLTVLIASCGKKAEPEGVPAPQSPEMVELTQQMRRYALEKRKLPTNLNELVVAGYIKVIPQAPAGKKYAVDSKRAEIILVEE